MKVETIYTLGCLSICLQRDKDLDVRCMALRMMSKADTLSKDGSDAFSAGRVDTAVYLSRVLARRAEKKGTRQKRS